MRKSFFLAVLTAISFSIFAQGTGNDTCRCQKKEKQHYTAPSKGQIMNSFNDNVIIEDHTGGPISLSSFLMPERFMPPIVSNLKQITGSFNRYITVRRFPAPVAPRSDCYHRWWYSNDADLLWLILFCAVVACILYLATRPHNAPPSVTVTNTVPPAPAPVVIVPPTEKELDAAMEKAKSSGSIFTRHPDGGYDICFMDPKPAPAEEKLAQ